MKLQSYMIIGVHEGRTAEIRNKFEWMEIIKMQKPRKHFHGKHKIDKGND
jgi:hypothetical protein